MKLNRRSVIKALPAAMSIAPLIFRAALAGETSESVIAPTTYGKVRGRRQADIAVFKGIPYAGRVSGDRRFKSPAPLKPWREVRDSLEFGPPAAQLPVDNYYKLEAQPSEDCLVLNVWTPEANSHRNRPVMVYCHGGGFVIGSGAMVDGAKLALTQDVVVVTTNHRLNVFGFLYLADVGGEEYAESGAEGLLDITAALNWIQRNIEAFGGDPTRIMIFGESGGGGKVAGLTTMPRAKGLFHRASIESIPSVHLSPRDRGIAGREKLLKALDLQPSQWKEVIGLRPARLLEAASKIGITSFGPVVDGAVIPQHPFDPTASPVSRDVPFIIGCNKDENIWFLQLARDYEAFALNDKMLQERLAKEFGHRAPRLLAAYRQSRPGASPTDIYIAITTANLVWNAMDTMAERKAELGGAPVYRYLFTYESNAKVDGADYPKKAMHSMEVDFKFDTVAGSAKVGTSPERFKVAANMSAMWAAFARTGNPSIPGQPQWQPSAPGRRSTMLINADCRMADDPFRVERRAWLAGNN